MNIGKVFLVLIALEIVGGTILIGIVTKNWVNVAVFGTAGLIISSIGGFIWKHF